jgi:beta-ureidopropionase / N-carbamoyl-L-amino-acid hydrolase
MNSALAAPRVDTAAPTAPLRINGPRLWQRLMDLAAIGATPLGGVRRVALTDADRAGRDQVVAWMHALGLSVRVDEVGNLFARRAGTDPTRAPVATGSHIDTQPNGGKFDGNYGVLAGLEVVQTLNDAGVATAAPIEVSVWTNEEGSRFTPVMMGSGAFVGAFSVDAVRAATDVDGHTVAGELARIGYDGPHPCGHIPGAPAYAAFFETHIEQGPVLENAGITIGVVSGALGQRWYDVTAIGQDSHAGPTPMALRRDAMRACAEVVRAVHAMALSEAPHGRGTVGHVRVAPNSRNTVPGRVDFTVDLRHPDVAGLQRLDAALHAACAQIEEATGCRLLVQLATQFAPCAFDLHSAVRQAAQTLGLSHMDVVSGAGHDAVYLARTCPTGMIFVPCKDGISHNEIEDAQPEHLEAGANVLLHAMLQTARG